MPFEEAPSTPARKKRAGEKVTVIGSFKIGPLLGKGSFCKVKLATHIVSGQQFAVKIIKAVASIKWSDIEREIAVMRKLSHPNIIKLYQVLYSDEHKVTHTFCSTSTLQSWRPRKLYMIMELAEGGELFDYIIKHNHLQEEEARRFFRQILGGLEYMHSHLVVHRDLKPENIVLDVHHNIKINDFGLSNFISPGSRLKTFCGSPVYAAPEIIRKKTYDGQTADVWSLGVMLFTMVTGHLPWRPSNSNPENYFNMLQGRFTIPSKIRLSPECKDILRRMINPDVKKRATIRELRNHPWTNEGYADRPPSFHPNYPPVPLDSSIVKRMVQMGYTSKEVQAVVLNNETSPILTTYHSIRNLSLEIVPDFHLHDGSCAIPIAPSTTRRPTTQAPQPTTSPPSQRAANAHSVSPESPRLDLENALSTPPLLAIACETPSADSSELSTSSPTISTFDELLSSSPYKFAGKARAVLSDFSVGTDNDYYESTPPLPHSFSLPDKRDRSGTSESPESFSPASPEMRPRGESDPAGAPVPDFDEMDKETNILSRSLPLPPDSPQEVDMVNFEAPPSPTPDARARALSVSDVGKWSDKYALEQTNVEDPWTIFGTLEDENAASRNLSRHALSSPAINIHKLSSSPPASPPSSPPSSPGSKHLQPRTHASSTSSPEIANVPDHPNSAPTKSTSKLQKLFSKFKFSSK